ncbi:MAG: lytic transglycosylase domain-containing protein [Desulfurella sp.]
MFKVILFCVGTLLLLTNFSKADVFQHDKGVEVITMNEYNNNMQPNTQTTDSNPYFFVRYDTPKKQRNSYSKYKYSKNYYYSYYTNNFASLFQEIGRKFNIDPKLLYAIAVTESSLNPNAVNYNNTNGSIDYGLMQINSCHLPTLERYGITKNDLFNPKTNVSVGAWILGKCIQKYGYSWQAIACYHTGNGSLNNKEALRYVWEVYRNLKG